METTIKITNEKQFKHIITDCYITIETAMPKYTWQLGEDQNMLGIFINRKYGYSFPMSYNNKYSTVLNDTIACMKLAYRVCDAYLADKEIIKDMPSYIDMLATTPQPRSYEVNVRTDFVKGSSYIDLLREWFLFLEKLLDCGEIELRIPSSL